MKKLILILFFLVPSITFAQRVEVVKFSFLDSLIKNNWDTTYVVNFWASWCKPCVKELPAFEELNEKYANKNVRVILASLNFKSELETRLIPFIREKKIQSKIILLDDPDYNSWIDRIDKSWGGDIPATLIINNKRNVRQFFKNEFTFEELENKIKQIKSQ